MNSVIDLSKTSGRREVAQVSESASLIHAIASAARDPSTDMDKMERLFAMHEKMIAREAETAFNTAMSLAQAAMGRVSADATNPQTHSKYASYAALDRALRPIYTKHGFALSYNETESPKADHTRILCYVTHSAGHARSYQIDMPTDGKGAKGGDVMTKTHATGAAHTYGRRYLLKDVFNVAVGEGDNDGNGPKVSADQVAALEEMIKNAGVNAINFLNWLRVKSLGDILACNYEYCVEAIERKAKEVNPRGDLSGVDVSLRDRHVSTIADLLAQDKDEVEISKDLNAYAAENLSSFSELYIMVLDELAAKSVISKANWKKYLKISQTVLG